MPKAKAQPAAKVPTPVKAPVKPAAKQITKAQAAAKAAKVAKPATKVQATPKVAPKSKGVSQTTQKSTKSQKIVEVAKKRTPAIKKMEATTPIKQASQKIKKDAKSKPPSPKKEDARPSAQPKKAGSAYMFFNSEMQAQMKSMEKFKGLGFGERTKVVGESWAKLNEEQKAEYVKRSEDDKKRHEKELKQLEKKGFFKDKDGKDSRDLYKPEKQKKSTDAETQKSTKSKSPAKKKDDKEKEKAKKEKERERAKKLKEKEKVKAKKLKEKERKLKKKELLLDDRAKPKQPYSAYVHFSVENAKKYPDLSMCEQSKKSGEDWKKLSDDQKKKWDKVIEKDKARFERETKEFNEKGFFTNSAGIKSTFLTRKHHKVLEFEKGTVKPKKTKPSWMIFATEQHRAFKVQVPEGEKYNPWNNLTVISERWKALTDKERGKYDKLSEQDLVRHESEFAALRQDGFFVTSEGIKSTDLPPPVYKPKRMKKSRATKSTVVEEQPAN